MKLPLNVFRIVKPGREYFYYQARRKAPRGERGPLIRLYGEPGSVEFAECVDAAERRSGKAGERKPTRMEGAFVYFLISGGNLKIGYSKDPLGRLATLQTGLAQTITSITCVPGSRRLERRLHDALARDRLRGEWFRLSNKALKLIADAALGRIDLDEGVD